VNIALTTTASSNAYFDVDVFWTYSWRVNLLVKSWTLLLKT